MLVFKQETILNGIFLGDVCCTFIYLLQVSGLNEGKEYQFRVKAVNAEGESEPLETDIPTLAKNPYCKLKIVPVTLLSDIQIFKESLAFMVLKGSLPCRQWPITGPYHELAESSPYSHLCLDLLSGPFTYVFHTNILYTFFLSPMH